MLRSPTVNGSSCGGGGLRYGQEDGGGGRGGGGGGGGQQGPLAVADGGGAGLRGAAARAGSDQPVVDALPSCPQCRIYRDITLASERGGGAHARGGNAPSALYWSRR
jgi:hypothetical protein